MLRFNGIMLGGECGSRGLRTLDRPPVVPVLLERADDCELMTVR